MPTGATPRPYAANTPRPRKLGESRLIDLLQFRAQSLSMSTIVTIIGFVLFAAAMLTGAILAQSDYAAVSRDRDGATKNPAESAEQAQGG